ncbi:MAG TPA: primosomal protein N' [Candidatus Sulfobium mesophilum]|nr:primosomal protein N' [Candidatus Sulfobium mesophilum]
MIKLSVQYVDIIFPVNLRPLTYKCPDHLSGRAKAGLIVSAPLKNTISKGIILNINVSAPAGGPIKEFSSIDSDSPVFGRGMLKLLHWMSDYYIASEGSILQQMAPKELFARTRAKSKTYKSGRSKFKLISIPEKDTSPITETAAEGRYRTFLLRAPSANYEYSFAAELLRTATMKNLIVVFPEVSHAETFYSTIKDSLGDRACLLHGEISRGRRSDSLEGIISGKHDIVIGTRAALFAPMKTVSLIAVLREENASYKLEEGVRYNIRDVAVMRGFLEQCTVLLSSVTPSIDSSFNVLTKKYILVKPSLQAGRPRITIVNMRYAKKIRPGISRDVFDAVRNKLKAEKKIMLVSNRRGYSTLLLCADCGHEERCNSCDIPFVMHKEGKILKCHYCGKVITIPDKCGKCGGLHIELLGAGTQRIQEEIKELFGVEALRFDSDGVTKKSDALKLLGSLSADSASVLIGTKMMTKRIGPAEKFTLAAVLNTDSYLNFPDFRASEKAYRELAAVIDLVEPGGEVMFQTRLPQSSLLRSLKTGDYDAFIKEELAARKELAYPPYSKLLKITVSGNVRITDTLAGKISAMERGIEVLGPATSRNKQGKEEASFFLRSASRKSLNEAARSVLRMCEGKKELRIVIDVDPA